MTQIVLYGPANTPFTEKVRRALLWKKLDFELREPAGPEDYKRWSPKTGLLPVVRIDGELISDSTDILYALEARFPTPPMLSADPRIAGQQKQLEDWADENLLYYFNKWRSLQPEIEAERGGGSALHRLRAWLRAGGTWESPEVSIVRGLGDRLDALIGFLGTRPFFYSDSLSMADLSVYSMLLTMRRGFLPGSEKLLQARPLLIDLMRRIEQATDGPDA